jgi:hypothetical protein
MAVIPQSTYTPDLIPVSENKKLHRFTATKKAKILTAKAFKEFTGNDNHEQLPEVMRLLAEGTISKAVCSKTHHDNSGHPHGKTFIN